MYSLRKSIKIYYFNSLLNNRVPTSVVNFDSFKHACSQGKIARL